MRIAVLMLSLALIAPIGVRAQEADSPEAAARAFAGRLAAGDWDGMAALMHPTALAQFRQMLGPVLDHPAGGQIRQALFGASEPDSLTALSDARLFGRFIGAVLSQDADMLAAVRDADVHIVGHVMEGDTAHVVSRSSLDYDGMEMTQMEVSSFVPHEGRWFALLTGEFSGMAAAFARMLEALPAGGPGSDPRN